MAKMTAKQKRFCDEYLISLNATQAAIKAGYTEKYAHTNANKLLQNTTVKQYLADRMAEKESELIASQDEVLRYLTAVMRGEEQDEVMNVNPMGEIEKNEIKRQANQIKAAETLAKYHGLLTDKVELSGKVENPLAGLTTDELRKLIK